MNNGIKIAITIISIIILIILIWQNTHNKWSLFIYPNGNPAEESIITINAYNSFSECQKGYEFNLTTLPKASFECGYKCTIQDAGLQLYICDETRDY